MDVTIDRTRCQGIGMCELHAPDLFEVAEEGYATLRAGAEPATDAAAALEAVQSCPAQALGIKQ